MSLEQDYRMLFLEDEKNKERIVALEKQITILQDALKHAHDHLCSLPELNMANYTVDQVAELNTGVCEVCCELEDAIKAAGGAE